MPQSNRISVDNHAAALAVRSGPDEYSPVEYFIKYADQTVPVVLRHGTDVLTTDVHRLERKAEEHSGLPSREQIDDGFFRKLNFPKTRQQSQPTTTLHPLQEWEGYILEIGPKDFVARLIDLTASSTHENEEAVIPLAEISEEDAAKMSPGSIFRWVIGYERSPSGTKKRVSQIVFRDLPAITKTDIREGESWALETIRSIKL